MVQGMALVLSVALSLGTVACAGGAGGKADNTGDGGSGAGGSAENQGGDGQGGGAGAGAESGAPGGTGGGGEPSGGSSGSIADAGMPASDARVVISDTRSAADTGAPSSLLNEEIAWNGDGVGNGSETHWMGRGQDGKTTLTYATGTSHSPSHAMAFAMGNINYGEFGWGIRSFAATRLKKIGFWLNMVRDPGKISPGDVLVTLKVGGVYAAPGGGRGVETSKYNPKALQGGWQQVVIPVADIVGSATGNITELLIGLAGCASTTCQFTLFVDDVSFGN